MGTVLQFPHREQAVMSGAAVPVLKSQFSSTTSLGKSRVLDTDLFFLRMAIHFPYAVIET